MVNSIEESGSGRSSGEFGANISITPQENFVNGLYSSADESTACELRRLRSEEGIIPTCHVGCCHCCRYHILTTPVEVHTLAQYVRRTLSPGQIDDLRMRTQQWHEWDNYRPGRYPFASIYELAKFSNYDHCCPLLVDGLCSVYPVRPVVCRTHFVSSHPFYCCAASDPESTEDAPVPLPFVVTATRLASMVIRDHIEGEGLDFSRSMMLLPHGLAIEMGWDFSSCSLIYGDGIAPVPSD